MSGMHDRGVDLPARLPRERAQWGRRRTTWAKHCSASSFLFSSFRLTPIPVNASAYFCRSRTASCIPDGHAVVHIAIATSACLCNMRSWPSRTDSCITDGHVCCQRFQLATRSHVLTLGHVPTLGHGLSLGHVLIVGHVLKDSVMCSKTGPCAHTGPCDHTGIVASVSDNVVDI